VVPSLQPVEVGSFSGMGCMVPQPYAAIGNWSYPEILGHNRQPMVPRVNYPDNTLGGVAISGGDGMDYNTRVYVVRCTWGPVATSYPVGQ
jgi:hypothetical protein